MPGSINSADPSGQIINLITLSDMQFIKKNWIILAVLVLLFLAVFLRFWDLNTVPPGLYPDEAKNANDAVETMQSGNYKVFYEENNGREGLYIWLLAASFKLFGISITSFRAVSAAIGSLTILGTYLLTKEVLRFASVHAGRGSKIRLPSVASSSLALLSAGFMTASFWHLNFSRIGFRAILVPLLLSFGIYFTLKTLRTKNILYALSAGVIWGAGFYSYISFRIALAIPVFLVTTAFIFYLWQNPPRLFSKKKPRKTSLKTWFKEMYIKEKWWIFDVMFTALIAVMAPLIVFFFKNKENFISRATGISVFDAEAPIFAFLKSLGAHIQMLFFVGDGNWRHNFAEEPQLSLPVAVFFVAGVIYSIVILKDAIKEKNYNAITVHSTLAVSFGLMLMPAALTIESIPHALRSIGLMPFVFVYAALGFMYILRLVFPHKHHRKEVWPFAFGTIFVIILLLISAQFTHYFADWGKNEEVKKAFTRDHVEIGKYFNSLPSSAHKYLIVDNGAFSKYPDEVLLNPEEQNRLPLPAQSVLFVQRTKSTPVKNTTYVQKKNIPVNIEGESVLVPMHQSEEVKKTLEMFYPQGEAVSFSEGSMWGWRVE